MPAPGERSPIPASELIKAGTDARDMLLSWMQLAEVLPPLIQKSTLIGPEHITSRFSVKPGDVLGALDDPLRRLVEQALGPYTDIGVAGATPEHRWRAAEHFRPFHAICALVEAIKPMVKPLSAYTDHELEAELARRS